MSSDLKPIPKRVVAYWEETRGVSVRSWARLTVFRSISLGAERYESAIEAAKKLSDEYREEFAKTGEDRLPFMVTTMLGEMLDRMATMSKDEVTNAVNGAAVVFAHSILDNETTAYCELAMQTDFARSEELLKDRKVRLADAASRPYDELLVEAIRAKKDELSRESLIKRLHFFFGYCTAIPKITNYTLDLERIERFDRARQDVVHEGRFDRLPSNMEDELDFIRHTGMYLANRFRDSYIDLFIESLKT